MSKVRKILDTTNVCSLHVPSNLVVITADENRKKSDRHDTGRPFVDDVDHFDSIGIPDEDGFELPF